MMINKYITTDPKICHGKPIFKGTRIMVYLVLDLLAQGIQADEIIQDYYLRLTKKSIQTALEGKKGNGR